MSENIFTSVPVLSITLPQPAPLTCHSGLFYAIYQLNAHISGHFRYGMWHVTQVMTAEKKRKLRHWGKYSA